VGRADTACVPHRTTLIISVALFATAIATVMIFAGGAAATGKHPRIWRQSKRQAEVTLLHATRALKRLDERLIDPRTHLVRTNTRAVCTGVSQRVAGKYTGFRCLISYRKQRILVAYHVMGTDGAALKEIR